MVRPIALLLLSSICLTGVVAAQPDRTAALEKAKAKFEKDIAKYDEALITAIDKEIVRAGKAGNKAIEEKLNYERGLFVAQHIVPTTFPSENYLQQRFQATASLQAVYQPAIKELTKAKKLAEATTLEDSLSELVKTSRGYGLAFPADLDAHPVFLIENKNSGLVIDSLNNEGYGDIALATKVGKRKLSQCWRIERDEKGFVIRNVRSGQGIDVTAGNTKPGTILATWPVDRKKEVNINSLFQLTEIQREIVIECNVNKLILTATERKVKGVTNTYVTQEKKEATPSPAQLWTLTELK